MGGAGGSGSGFAADCDHKVVRGCAANVLQAVHLVRRGEDYTAGPDHLAGLAVFDELHLAFADHISSEWRSLCAGCGMWPASRRVSCISMASPVGSTPRMTARVSPLSVFTTAN